MADGTLKQTQLKWKAITFALANPGATKVAIRLVSPELFVCYFYLQEKKNGLFASFLLYY